MTKATNNETMSKKKLTGAFDLFQPSMEAVKKNWQAFVILALPGFLSTLVSALSDTGELSYTGAPTGLPLDNTFLAFGLLDLGLMAGMALVAVVIGSLLFAAMTGLEIEAAKGKRPSAKQLWEYAKKYWLQLLGLQILVGVIIIAGLILFIVPGLIFLRRYYLSPYYLVDQNLSVTEAMKRSADESKPYSGYVWSIIGVGFLIGLASLVPLTGWIASAVLGLLYAVAPALRYFELKKVN